MLCRNHQKIRSLANHCLDLRFYKPRVEQVKGAMMSIAFKEGLRIPPPAMHKIIEAANSDIRQILNHICMWSAGSKSMTFDDVGEMLCSVQNIIQATFQILIHRVYWHLDYSIIF